MAELARRLEEEKSEPLAHAPGRKKTSGKRKRK
jgi:hypothetical protein